MAKWHFWGEKEFSDVYENIYIRGVNEDWLNIIFAITKEISKYRPLKKKLRILDDCAGFARPATVYALLPAVLAAIRTCWTRRARPATIDAFFILVLPVVIACSWHNILA